MDSMILASAVVVWEWLNQHGRWRPYGPAVCHHIEAALRNSDARGGSVVLGQVDHHLSAYIIDLQSMHQFRLDTGRIRPVRRCFYEPRSAPAHGWVWEWESETGQWNVFDTEVCIAMEEARNRLQPSLDLAPLGSDHVVHLKSMTQVHKHTQRCRRVQRRADMAYPLVSGPLPIAKPGRGALLGVGVSGVKASRAGSPPACAPSQPCSCQQCVLVQSVKRSSSRAGLEGGASTLGRRPAQQPANRSPKPRSATLGKVQRQKASCSPRSSPRSSPRTSRSLSLPHGLSITRNTCSSRRNAALFAQSLAALSLSASSHRTAPPELADDGQSVPTATLVTPATRVTTPPSPVPSPSPVVMKPQRAAGHAPLPQRTSLAGLSGPALKRIAMAQSKALIASGVPILPVKNLEGSGAIYPALAGITGILMSAAGLPVCLSRPPKLVLHPPPVKKKDIKPVPGLDTCSKKSTKKRARKAKTAEDVMKRFLLKVKTPPENEDCNICMEPLWAPWDSRGPVEGSVCGPEAVGRLVGCGHHYHLQCVRALYDDGNKDGSLQCPSCQTIYGSKTGSQPPGKMQYHVIPHSLPGHPDCHTIRIIYTIPPATQGPEHPNPGKPFTARGFPRHCYLPDNHKGRKVLRLLLEAWDRRLVFSVGTSSTTGEGDTVVWNQLHHKTEFGSNVTGHGFPDPGYLDRVLEELREHGITELLPLPKI
ncbi:E3 ubiquitin-protein ligase DTX4-like [Aplochiton taeniatus]